MGIQNNFPGGGGGEWKAAQYAGYSNYTKPTADSGRFVFNGLGFKPYIVLVSGHFGLPATGRSGTAVLANGWEGVATWGDSGVTFDLGNMWNLNDGTQPGYDVRIYGWG